MNTLKKKNGLTYLSWAWAWTEVKKACPDANYSIGETVYDENLGYMCHTSVTIEGETLTMWLPVMDGANKAMKKNSYTYWVKSWEGGKKIDVEKEVLAASMFDVNKAIMRCLTKNLAMFGLGIYIFAGEDLPETESEEDKKHTPPAHLIKKSAKSIDPADLVVLKKDSEEWKGAVRYIEANKDQGLDKILQQIGRKYKVSPVLKKEIEKLMKK